VLNSATPEWVDAGATLNNIGVCLHQLSRYARSAGTGSLGLQYGIDISMSARIFVSLLDSHAFGRYEEALLYFNGAHQAMGVWLNKAHPRMTVTMNNVDKTTAKCREYVFISHSACACLHFAQQFLKTSRPNIWSMRRVGLLGRDDALTRWQVQPDELNLAVLLAMKSGGGAKKKAAGGKKKKK
jgi:hypothetical protein